MMMWKLDKIPLGVVLTTFNHDARFEKQSKSILWNIGQHVVAKNKMSQRAQPAPAITVVFGHERLARVNARGN